MKNLIISIVILIFTVSAAHAQTVYFAATDTVHHLAMPLDSVYVLCNTNGADTTLYNNPEKLEIGGLLGVNDNHSENAYGIKLSAMNFVGGRLYVMVTSPKPDNITFLLSDLTGRTLINHSENCTQGANNFALDAPGIAAGMYFLTISNGFSAKTYKILGANSGSGDISITNIGFPITNVLAGTSNFTIIGYATGKIVTVLSDTIDNFTPVGNGKDTVKFEFDNEWSKWKFRKMTISINNINFSGLRITSSYNQFGNASDTVKVNKTLSLNFSLPDNRHLIMCKEFSFSNYDTIRLCYGLFENLGNLDSAITVEIVLDTSSSKIIKLAIFTHVYNVLDNQLSYEGTFSYYGSLAYEIKDQNTLYSYGQLTKEKVDYNRISNNKWNTGNTTHLSNEVVEYIKDLDLNYSLTLEP